MNYSILTIGLMVQLVVLAPDASVNIEHVLPVQAITDYVNQLRGNNQQPLTFAAFTEEHERSDELLGMAIDDAQRTFTIFSTPTLTTYFGAFQPGQQLNLLERFALSCAYYAETDKKKSWLPWSIAFHPELSTRGRKREAWLLSILGISSLTAAFLQLDNPTIQSGQCSYPGNPVVFGALGGVLGSVGVRHLVQAHGLSLYTSPQERKNREAIFQTCKKFPPDDLMILKKSYRGVLTKVIDDIIDALAQVNVQEGR